MASTPRRRPPEANRRSRPVAAAVTTTSSWAPSAAPALKGDGFFSHWENDTLDKLFTKIRDTMPAGGIESVTDAGKLDILAYVLSVNGAPAGREELSIELPALEAITIVRQGGAPEGVSNFNLVQLVGCLAPAGDNGWKLTNASEPVVTKEEASTPAAIAKASGQPLGRLNFDLVSVISAYQADARVGQKVEARGLIFRATNDNAINLTSLQVHHRGAAAVRKHTIRIVHDRDDDLPVLSLYTLPIFPPSALVVRPCFEPVNFLASSPSGRGGGRHWDELWLFWMGAHSTWRCS